MQVAPPGAAALTINGSDRDLAITPDGSRIVYVGNNGTQLFVRGLDALEPGAVFTGALARRSPFVSPDGQWIGFVGGSTTLWKVAVTGGPVLTLTQIDGTSPRGAQIVSSNMDRNIYNIGHETDFYSGPESAIVGDGGRGRVGRHDRRHAPQPAGRAARPGPLPTRPRRPARRWGAIDAGDPAGHQGPLPEGAGGRPGRPVSPDAETPAPRRRLYLDTSAYLCILLAEDGWERLSGETARAELVSSVLLVLEARRNLIRLAREGTLSPDQYKDCMDRVEQDTQAFVLRDLTLDLCASNLLPALATPRSLDLGHLRTALWFHAADPVERFMTLDAAQKQAARELGLSV